MRLESIKLLKVPNKSFILFHETHPFSSWHSHPEYELVLIVKGKGRRMVGDHIDRFFEEDLVLVGPNLPHEWLCDSEFYNNQEGFQGEAIVYQFSLSFLGIEYFEVFENRNLKLLLENSSRGIKFEGITKRKIISLMKQNLRKDEIDQFYSLFLIFRILAKKCIYRLLAAPGFTGTFHNEGSESMRKALEYIFSNFHKKITIRKMLEITHMSNTSFCRAFKKVYRVTFKEFLTNARIGYSCLLLKDNTFSISQIAYSCGFENLSNYHRQFRKLKGITPSQFRNKLETYKIVDTDEN